MLEQHHFFPTLSEMLKNYNPYPQFQDNKPINTANVSLSAKNVALNRIGFILVEFSLSLLLDAWICVHSPGS